MISLADGNSNHRTRITIRSRLHGAMRLATVAVGLATILHTPASAQDAKTPVIMFQGLADPADLGSNAIYSVNADGTNLKRLTADDDHILNGAPYPQWSPDGQRIAFVNWARALSGGFVPTELYVMDRDGTNRRLLLHITEQSWQKTQSVSGVAWSPDGKTLAVTRLVAGLFLIPMDKPGLPRLTFQPKSAQDVSSAVWSPDGKKIAVYSYGQTIEGGVLSQTSEVHVVDADGSAEVTVGRIVFQSRFSQQGIPIRWSADGTKLFFPLMVAAPSGGVTIRGYVSNADGSGEMQATELPPYEKPSPDGSRIAFSNTVMDSRDGVFVKNKDGSGIRAAANDPDWACAIGTWSPDGQRLVLSCHYVKVPCKMAVGCNWRIFVVPADASPAKLTPIIDVDARYPSVAPAP
jgi:Tol biopolymer transport system component